VKIGFIGAGKVGVTLAKYFSTGHTIVGFYSKSNKSAEEAATFCGSKVYTTYQQLLCASDMVFITVPDGQIEATWNKIKESQINLSGKIFIHCSGALSSTVFTERKNFGAYGYSLHPLFAISSKYETYKELGSAFFAAEGDSEHLEDVVSLVKNKGNMVQVIDSAEKVRYHAAAVLASNQVIALYQIACNELVRCGFSEEAAEKALVPLFIGNAEHVAKDGVVASLTGPAERGDFVTIQKHLECLEGTAKDVYSCLNEVLLEIAARKHVQS
jgi:predicted short-subunit dehydrogenase-like oxidoreductase (DUF2520 family)